MHVTGGVTYDVYTQIDSIYRAAVSVGNNDQDSIASILDVDIIYTDFAKKEIAGFAVYLNSQGDCYLSK